MQRNVVVVGLDEVNHELLSQIEDAERYRFHEALPLGVVQGAHEFHVREWLEEARRVIRGFTGPADGIIGFWDFPISLMVPILIDEFGTTGPSLRSVVRCEHKYWSRRNQREVVPEAVPEFRAVDPTDDASVEALDLPYPFWLKPVKAFSSQLGFKVESDDDLRRALEIIRAGIGRFAEPFNELLTNVELPAEIEKVDGRWCVAEELLRGSQHTIAGYAHRGRVEMYGMIDSINYPDSTSFFRYRYPSHLPGEVQERGAELARRIMRHVEFDNWPFNIEVFYDRERDLLRVLEVNTRISQSHSDLFRKVGGASNHQVLVELATGQTPNPPSGEGAYGSASKLHIRAFSDGVVRRTPGEEEIRRVEEELPGTLVLVQVAEGDRLSELEDQEPYSYRLGVVYMGGDDDRTVMERWQRCREMLDFEIDPVEPAED